jgi:glycosyltransferase involved in cell wall biosynthesis
MRIAYVSADRGVPIFGQKGCSIHAQEVLRALVRHGAQIDLFSTRCEGTPPDDIEAVGRHPLPRATEGDPAVREKASLTANEALRAELERIGPFDLIYERYSLWSFAAMEFAQNSGLPGLLEVNAPLIEEQAQYRVLVDRAAAEQVAERVFGAATYLLAVSDEVAAYLERFPAARGKIRVVPNGVRPERFPENLEPALPAADGVFTIGFVGTLKAWHGLSLLVQAFALLHARQPRSRLVIVGHGPERDHLDAEITVLGLKEAVHFTGAVTPEKVPALLASMDVTVAPYPKLPHFYFSPLKVYEYMAAGRPVVASLIGQLEKLIQPEVNGLLVPAGDVAALAAALERLQADEGLRLRLGRAARATVLRDYTWDSIAERILSLAEPRKARCEQPALANP